MSFLRACKVGVASITALVGGTLADGVAVGRDAAGRLGVYFDVPQPHLIETSVFPGYPGYTTGLFGFGNISIDVPSEGLFMLSEAADIQAVLVGVDPLPGLRLHNGLHLMQVGDTIDFGHPFFDYHPLFQITPDATSPGVPRLMRFYLRDLSGIYTDSAEFTIRFKAAVPACAADLGKQGGLLGGDGALDNNDFVVFIDRFFATDPIVDRGVQGGLPGSDQAFDNNDFVVFIDQFFDGCA